MSREEQPLIEGDVVVAWLGRRPQLTRVDRVKKRGVIVEGDKFTQDAFRLHAIRSPLPYEKIQ